MKTGTEFSQDGIPDFSGIVIDPATGRKVAIAVDITRGLGLLGNQIIRTDARVYQGRFYDIQDVLEARAKIKKTRPAGLPGMLLTELASVFDAGKPVALSGIESLETIKPEGD